jgi:hypothetical protein
MRRSRLFNISWVEMPASIGGSVAFRGDSRQTFPAGGGSVVTNGQSETFFALTTGAALGFDVPTQPPTVGNLTKQTLP